MDGGWGGGRSSAGVLELPPAPGPESVLSEGQPRAVASPGTRSAARRLREEKQRLWGMTVGEPRAGPDSEREGSRGRGLRSHTALYRTYIF